MKNKFEQLMQHFDSMIQETDCDHLLQLYNRINNIITTQKHLAAQEKKFFDIILKKILNRYTVLYMPENNNN